MFSPRICLLSFLIFRVVAVPTRFSTDDPHYTQHLHKTLSEDWYHDQDHPIHALFKRAPEDGTEFADIGTPAWAFGYPPGPPDPDLLPAEWVNALDAAIAAGKIPDIPQTTNTQGFNPVYPFGFNPTSPQICSSTYKCRLPGDIWDSPDGVFASSFDDGPTPSTPMLVDFLKSVNQTTTHFMIGSKMLYQPTQLAAIIDSGNDLAIHTWTHPYMTTLSNHQIVGQLGWTMQLIYNSTKGRVAKYWRPPYGDSDARVSAIAKEVFGLRTVIWNHDTDDWIGTPQSIGTTMSRFLASPKSPGLIVLQHELTDMMVNAFIAAFPQIESNGWRFASLAKALEDGRAYQNSQSPSSNDVYPDVIVWAAEPSSTTESIASAAVTGSLYSAIAPGASAIAANNAGISSTKSSAALRIFPATTPACISLLLSCVTSALIFSMI